MPELITAGKLYICVTPLYKISYGSTFDYAYSDKELNVLRKKNKSKIKGISRFKGLGEQATEEIAETALNPATRKLKQITLQEVSEAENMTRVYMGTKVDQRKENIMNLATDESVNIDY